MAITAREEAAAETAIAAAATCVGRNSSASGELLGGAMASTAEPVRHPATVRVNPVHSRCKSAAVKVTIMFSPGAE